MNKNSAGGGSDNSVRIRPVAPWPAFAFPLLSILLIVMSLALPAMDALSGPDDGRSGRSYESGSSPDDSDVDMDGAGLPVIPFRTVFLDRTFLYCDGEGLRPWSRAISLYKPPR